MHNRLAASALHSFERPKPSYGPVDYEEVEAMVQESFEKAEDDFKERQAREARIEADRVLAAVEKAKKSDAFWELPEDERAAIDRAVNELLVVYCCADHFLIRIKMEQVDHVTHHLAEIMVNSAVSGALKGTKI